MSLHFVRLSLHICKAHIHEDESRTSFGDGHFTPSWSYFCDWCGADVARSLWIPAIHAAITVGSLSISFLPGAGLCASRLQRACLFLHLYRRYKKAEILWAMDFCAGACTHWLAAGGGSGSPLRRVAALVLRRSGLPAVDLRLVAAK